MGNELPNGNTLPDVLLWTLVRLIFRAIFVRKGSTQEETEVA